jgi:ATP-binding cassette, subfamily B, bacterial
MEDITTLADKIGFTDFIINNKKGYDTVLDPTGKRLSQHVRQNIKLMRALLGKPTLLLLETPLEHLNYQQQFTMMEYLRLESNATVIIISNDKDLQELSDQVLVLENGVIIN